MNPLETAMAEVSDAHPDLEMSIEEGLLQLVHNLPEDLDIEGDFFEDDDYINNQWNAIDRANDVFVKHQLGSLKDDWQLYYDRGDEVFTEDGRGILNFIIRDGVEEAESYDDLPALPDKTSILYLPPGWEWQRGSFTSEYVSEFYQQGVERGDYPENGLSLFNYLFSGRVANEIRFVDTDQYRERYMTGEVVGKDRYYLTLKVMQDAINSISPDTDVREHAIARDYMIKEKSQYIEALGPLYSM